MYHLLAAEAYFDDKQHYDSIRTLCSYTHPELPDGEARRPCRSLRELKQLLAASRQLQFCDICLEGRKVWRLLLSIRGPCVLHQCCPVGSNASVPCMQLPFGLAWIACACRAWIQQPSVRCRQGQATALAAVMRRVCVPPWLTCVSPPDARTQVFIPEQQVYSRQELDRHNRSGDAAGPLADSGFKGHPQCRFCRRRFYGDSELFLHMQARCPAILGHQSSPLMHGRSTLEQAPAGVVPAGKLGI